MIIGSSFLMNVSDVSLNRAPISAPTISYKPSPINSAPTTKYYQTINGQRVEVEPPGQAARASNISSSNFNIMPNYIVPKISQAPLQVTAYDAPKLSLQKRDPGPSPPEFIDFCEDMTAGNQPKERRTFGGLASVAASNKIVEERTSFRSTHGLQDQDVFSHSGPDSPSVFQSHRPTSQIERISANLENEQPKSKTPPTLSDKLKSMLLSKVEQAKAAFGQPDSKPAHSQFIVPGSRGGATPRASTEPSNVVGKLNDLSARLGLDVNDGMVILLATAVFTVMLLLVLWTMIRRH